MTQDLNYLLVNNKDCIRQSNFFKPEILVLDESTSSLDSFNESKIIENIVSNKDEITVLWVSHNKKYFKNFNKCYELKNGSFSQIK